VTGNVSIRRAFWAYFFASVTASVVMSANSMLVGVVVGQTVGPDAVSAINLALPLLTVVTLVPTFIVLGANLLASKAVGRGDGEEVKRLFTVSLFAGLALTGLFAAVCRLFAFDAILSLLTREARLVPLLRDYLPLALVSCLGTVTYLAFGTFAKVVGRPQRVIWGACADLAVCLAVTFLLVRFCGFGLPGAALGMFAGYLASTVPLLGLFRSEAKVFGFRRVGAAGFGASVKECLAVGVPLGIGTLVLAVIVLALNTFAQKCGGADAAFVTSVALQLIMFGMLVLQGANAAVMNVGASLWGKCDFVGYRALLRHVFIVLCSVQVAATVAVALFPGPLASLFGAEATLAATAAEPLREMVFAIPPLGLVLLLVGVYTLEGHGKAALVMQLGMFVLMLVPAGVAAAFAPRLFWGALPAGLFALLGATCLWSFRTARRTGRLHPLTLAPLARGDSRPIGVFDSGLGGLTVLNAMLGQDAVANGTLVHVPDGIPDFAGERFVYLGDQANMPYGDYPGLGKADFLRGLVLNDVRFLLEKDVKIVVIACNTATAYAFDAVRDLLARRGGIRLIGVVEAGAKDAVSAALRAGATGSWSVGVLATDGTVASGVYEHTLRAELARRGVTDDVRVFSRGCPGLADAVETGDPRASEIACGHLRALMDEQRRTAPEAPLRVVVLGCTHFPFVCGELERMASGLAFVDPSSSTAVACHDALAEEGLLAGGTARPTVDAYVSVPSYATSRTRLDARGWFTREYKYGRENPDDASTRILPLAGALAIEALTFPPYLDRFPCVSAGIARPSGADGTALDFETNNPLRR